MYFSYTNINSHSTQYWSKLAHTLLKNMQPFRWTCFNHLFCQSVFKAIDSDPNDLHYQFFLRPVYISGRTPGQKFPVKLTRTWYVGRLEALNCNVLCIKDVNLVRRVPKIELLNKLSNNSVPGHGVKEPSWIFDKWHRKLMKLCHDLCTRGWYFGISQFMCEQVTRLQHRNKHMQTSQKFAINN